MGVRSTLRNVRGDKSTLETWLPPKLPKLPKLGGRVNCTAACSFHSHESLSSMRYHFRLASSTALVSSNTES